MEDGKETWASQVSKNTNLVRLNALKLEVYETWSMVENRLKMMETRPELPENRDEDIIRMNRRLAAVARASFDECIAALDKHYNDLNGDDDYMQLMSGLNAERALNAGPLNTEGFGPLPQLKKLAETINQLALLPYCEKGITN